MSHPSYCLSIFFDLCSVGEDTVVEPDITQGTPRYMAPEIVNGTIKLDSFEAFKMADIYSLGLVLHEICQ